jgi:hypothetical protein
MPPASRPLRVGLYLSQIEAFMGLGITTFFIGAQAFVQKIDDLPKFCDRVVERFKNLD